MKILVTGGIGNVGTHLVPMLTSAGHQVSLVVRNTKKQTGVQRMDAHFPGLGLDCIESDLAELGRIEPSSRYHFDAVIHMAATLDLGEDKDNSILNNNIQGTRGVLQFIRDNKIPHLCYVSTAYTQQRNAYEISKEYCEKLIQAWRPCDEKDDFSYTILKPSILIGTPENPGPIQGVTLVAKALMIVLKFVDRTVKGISTVAMLPTLEGVTRLKGIPDCHLNVIPVDVVAEGIAGAFMEKNRILYLTNPKPPTVQEVASEIGDAFGVRFVIQEEFKASIPERILQKETKPVQPYLCTDQCFPSILTDYHLEPGYIESLVRKSFL